MSDATWEPKWGDKVRHGALTTPRWFVGLNPKLTDDAVLVDEMGLYLHASPSVIRPWEAAA